MSLISKRVILDFRGTMNFIEVPNIIISKAFVLDGQEKDDYARGNIKLYLIYLKCGSLFSLFILEVSLPDCISTTTFNIAGFKFIHFAFELEVFFVSFHFQVVLCIYIARSVSFTLHCA